MQALEKMLDDVFKNIPPLPPEARKGLATAMPWLALASGVISLVVALSLYQAATRIDYIFGYATPVTGISQVIWAGIVVLVLQAVLSFVAFPALRTNKKRGWDLMLLMALVSVVYGVIYNLFVYGVNVGGFIFSLIGSAVGLYLLFQVRSYFGGAATTATPAPTATPKTDKKE